MQIKVRSKDTGPGWVHGGSLRKSFIPGFLHFICEWEGKKIKWRKEEEVKESQNKDRNFGMTPQSACTLSHLRWHPVIQWERGRPAQCNLHSNLWRKKLHRSCFPLSSSSPVPVPGESPCRATARILFIICSLACFPGFFNSSFEFPSSLVLSLFPHSECFYIFKSSSPSKNGQYCFIRLRIT